MPKLLFLKTIHLSNLLACSKSHLEWILGSFTLDFIPSFSTSSRFSTRKSTSLSSSFVSDVLYLLSGKTLSRSHFQEAEGGGMSITSMTILGNIARLKHVGMSWQRSNAEEFKCSLKHQLERRTHTHSHVHI